MKKFILTCLIAFSTTPALAATKCNLLPYKAGGESTPLKLASQNEFTSIYSTSYANVIAELKVMMIPTDNPEKPVVGPHVEARIFIDGKMAAGVISDSFKPGSGFLVDAPGARLICEL
jgi:hypothetical protein